MKIVVNGRFLIPHKLEGIGYYTLEIIKQLSTRFPQHTFDVLVDRPSNHDWGFGKNVKLVTRPPQARHPVLFYTWFQWSVKRYLKRSRAELFISFDGFCTLGANCPTILTIHDVAFMRFGDHIGKLVLRYYRYFTPKFIAESSQIVTVSQFSKSEIEHYFPISSSKVSVSCNGVKQSFSQATPAEPIQAEDYFVVLGAIQPRKNLYRVIQAFVEFKQQNRVNTKLVIIGRKGWKYAEVLNMAMSSASSQDIEFTGYLSEDELITCLKKSLALIYVSLYEGFGVPIIEAMSLGVPVLTSDKTSTIEVAGEAALLVSPTDTKAITEAMNRLWKDQTLREDLSKKGLRRAQHYSWFKAAQPFVDYINKLGSSYNA